MKTISMICVLTQLIGATGAFAATQNPNPERILLESVISLQGQKVSPSEAQNGLKNAVKTYVSATPTDSTDVRQQRLQSAMVELGIYTPAQASEFVTLANAQAQKLGSSDHSIVLSEIQNLTNSAPKGAQFSACAASNALILTSGGTFMLAWIAGVSDYLGNDQMPAMLDVAYGSFGVSIVTLMAALMLDSGSCEND